MNKRRITSWLAYPLALSMLFACGSAPQPAQSSEPLAGSSHPQASAEICTWDGGTATSIALNGEAISVEGSGAVAAGSSVTINAAGVYLLSGSLTDGQIVVDTESEEPVRLVLNGVDLASTSSAPISIVNADDAVIILAEGTENRVSDGTTYVFATAEEDEPNAAIFSRSDLTICGPGTLSVSGNYNDGIASKDGLVIAGGTIFVGAVDDGIRGKDYLVIQDGVITVTAQGDGLKSDNAEDTTLGYVAIDAGTINVTSGGDAIQAESSVTIAGGVISLAAGGGSRGASGGWTTGSTEAAKGIQATVGIQIDGGTLTIDATDDALNANSSLVVNGGTLTLSSGDDGMHADTTLTINGGDIRITRSYEGIESAAITINGGTIHVVASDDGLNAAGGIAGSGMLMGGPGRGGRGQGGPGQDMFAASGDYHLIINGGYLAVDAGGDGLDSNGSFEMTGGIALVNGPTENMNGALDAGSFTISGGLLVAAGSAGMAEAPGDASTQYSVLVNFSSPLQAGSLVQFRAGDGSAVLTFAPSKTYQSIVFSSPELVAGATYEVYVGGSVSGTATDSLISDGAYTSGELYTSFTVSQVTTWIGSAARW